MKQNKNNEMRNFSVLLNLFNIFSTNLEYMVDTYLSYRITY